MVIAYILGLIVLLVILQTIGMWLFEWCAQRNIAERKERARAQRLSQPLASLNGSYSPANVDVSKAN